MSSSAIKQGEARLFETFSKAASSIPLCLAGGYDALAHTTIEDLLFLANHELDLHGEKEIELSRRELDAVVKYRNRVQNTIIAWRTGIINRCPKCKLRVHGKRESFDPPQAVVAEHPCPECVGSDFSQTFYFDAMGRELVSEDGRDWHPITKATT